jgi:3-dehydroquinate dehydratase-1
MTEVIAAARQKGAGLIVSFHDFQTTPTARSLCTKADAARKVRADVFKVATRADTAAQLQRLLDFSTMVDMPCAIMAMGRLSLRSRILFAERGSVFVYGAIARTAFAGQPTLAQIRSALA